MHLNEEELVSGDQITVIDSQLELISNLFSCFIETKSFPYEDSLFHFKFIQLMVKYIRPPIYNINAVTVLLSLAKSSRTYCDDIIESHFLDLFKDLDDFMMNDYFGTCIILANFLLYGTNLDVDLFESIEIGKLLDYLKHVSTNIDYIHSALNIVEYYVFLNNDPEITENLMQILNRIYVFTFMKCLLCTTYAKILFFIVKSPSFNVQYFGQSKLYQFCKDNFSEEFETLGPFLIDFIETYPDYTEEILELPFPAIFHNNYYLESESYFETLCDVLKYILPHRPILIELEGFDMFFNYLLMNCQYFNYNSKKCLIIFISDVIANCPNHVLHNINIDVLIEIIASCTDTTSFDDSIDLELVQSFIKIIISTISFLQEIGDSDANSYYNCIMESEFLMFFSELCQHNTNLDQSIASSFLSLLPEQAQISQVSPS